MDRAPQRVSLENASVAYWDAGSGAPLVFVHGYFLSARTWRKVIPALEPTYRCIALDLMGAGETRVDPTADLSISAQARMLAGFLDALDLSSVTLVAHNSGAVLTRLLAVSEPTRVARLVLSNTEIPGCPVHSAHIVQKVLRLPGTGRVFEGMVRSRFFLWPLLLRTAIHDRSRFDSNEFIATHREPLLSSRACRASRQFAVQWDLGFVDELPHHRLMMPKLVLWGDQDAFISPERARRFYDALPNPKQFVSIENCGTLPHEERPAAWLEVVSRFLAQTDAVMINTGGAA